MLTLEQKLYHQTLAIRPKLIKLIEKYSQKKGTGPLRAGFLHLAHPVLTPRR
jgi:hypothetical protein